MLEKYKQKTFAVADQSSANVWTLTAANLGWDPSGTFSLHQLQVSAINGNDAGENGSWKVEFKPDLGASGVLAEQATGLTQVDTCLFEAAFVKTIIVTVAPHEDQPSNAEKLVITSRRKGDNK